MPSRNGQLRGQIVDAKTGKPLAGASIFLANQQAGVSNQAGAFAISNLPQGNYSVVVKMNGYMDAGGTVAIRAGEAITTSFRLNPKAPVIRLRSNLVQAN
jgi:iron complex outermembrane receptor protein